MSDAPSPAPVQPGPEALPSPPPAPEPYPFWGYSDLLLFAGLTIPCMLLGAGVVKLMLWMFHVHPALRVAELLPQQFLGYVFLFGMLLLIFRLEYERPFWTSLAFTHARAPLLWIVIAGFSAAYGVAILSNIFQMPNSSNPMMDLLKDRTSVILMAIFGITLAPLCEELIFRGFLQPLLVRSLGAAPGILAAAIPFGLLHFSEYGNSWRHMLLISLAGATFGWMRHATGSTRASTIMHASYNALFFLALFAQRTNLPQAK